MNIADIVELRWRWGGPRDFWLLNATVIKQMIDANKLHPVAPEFTNGPLLATHMPQENVPAGLQRVPFPGGIRMPHLHFEGNAYLVSEEQWRTFTGRVIEDFKGHLARAKNVSFSQMMSIGEATVHLHGI